MKRVHLLRQYLPKQTLGVFVVPLEPAGLWVCKTLELPWKQNLNNVSCIPDGEYRCEWTQSPRMSQERGSPYFTYEVKHVPKRTGIRIHAANFYHQLLGCIALGNSHKDLNADMELDVVHSGKTLEEFNTLMNKEDFVLVVRGM